MQIKSQYEFRCQRCRSDARYKRPGSFVADLFILDEHPHQVWIDRGITPRYEGFAIEDGFYALYLRAIRTGTPMFADSGDANETVRIGRKTVYWAPGNNIPVDGALVLGATLHETCLSGSHILDVPRDKIRDAVTGPNRPRELHF